MFHAAPQTAGRAARHGRPTRFHRIEPVQGLLSWLLAQLLSGLSTVRRGWSWVWSVDHDDAASTAVAWLLQFCLMATLLFLMVAGTR